MDSEVLIQVQGVRKKFCRSLKRSLWYGMKDVAHEIAGSSTAHERLRPDEFWAVDDVSFELKRGECLGLIGRNGAGKTTLLKMLNGLIKPDAGRIRLRGRVGALIALGAGFNPILTGRENIYVNASVLGLTKKEINAKMDEITSFAEIGDAIDAPVQNYSSGMQVRLGFAVASALAPDILLLDEVLAVGDAAFRNKCYIRIGELRKKAAVIFVSHSMEQVSRISSSALVMSEARPVHLGSVADGVLHYERINDTSTGANESFLSLRPPIAAFSARLGVSQIRTGDPFTLSLAATSGAAVTDFQLRMYAYTVEGTCAGEFRCESKKHAVTLPPGKSTWTVVIDSVPLKNGRYKLNFNIIDSSGNLLVWSFKQHELVIVGGFEGPLADCQFRVRTWTEVSQES